MDLQIKPCSKNTHPIGGFFIKNPSILHWIEELQKLNFSLKKVEVYPLPDGQLNSIWGCLVVTFDPVKAHQVGRNELCQMVTPQYFIAERSILYPKMTTEEIKRLFPNEKYVLHPDFGMVELPEALNWSEMIQNPTPEQAIIAKPLEPLFVPKEIKSFQIKPLTEAEILANLEGNVFPKREKMDDTPLSLLEKAKLSLYKLLFPENKNAEKQGNIDEENSWRSKVESAVNSILPFAKEWTEKMQQDFENLQKRNQNEVDKLLDMLKNNPDEALKYAIPLDETGGSRGINDGQLDLSKRWGDFSLFGNVFNSNNRGGGVDLGDSFHKLQAQYNATAEALIKKKEYEKAAFVYLKLLKNYPLAAQTLEDGGFYQEASTIYLKHCNNKQKAAECYEKGKMTTNAIEIYKELNQTEKVGDLYLSIGRRADANVYFEKTVKIYKEKNQYVLASLVYKNKVNDARAGQSLLLSGWRENRDAFNCLNNYFSNIDDVKILKHEINSIYANEVTRQNGSVFLNVIEYEFKKKNELAESLRAMAYEIVADQILINPSIVSELKIFNEKDKILPRDTMIFKERKRK